MDTPGLDRHTAAPFAMTAGEWASPVMASTKNWDFPKPVMAMRPQADVAIQ